MSERSKKIESRVWRRRSHENVFFLNESLFSSNEYLMKSNNVSFGWQWMERRCWVPNVCRIVSIRSKISWKDHEPPTIVALSFHSRKFRRQQRTNTEKMVHKLHERKLFGYLSLSHTQWLVFALVGDCMRPIKIHWERPTDAAEERKRDKKNLMTNWTRSPFIDDAPKSASNAYLICWIDRKEADATHRTQSTHVRHDRL